MVLLRTLLAGSSWLAGKINDLSDNFKDYSMFLIYDHETVHPDSDSVRVFGSGFFISSTSLFFTFRGKNFVTLLDHFSGCYDPISLLCALNAQFHDQDDVI